MFGDFNEILGMHEKEGGAVRGERQIDAFREALVVCECKDLGFKGNIYTWQRGTSEETLAHERLDRYIACVGWCSIFHTWRKNDKLFQFEALWLSNAECGNVVSDVWCVGVNESVPTRIAWVEESLTSWAEKTFGVLKKKIKKHRVNCKRSKGVG
uniref:Exo_endo_phos domain-containing protein n=1 Tax=Chenopodium quinoa TaxID=63459 RepID=A0A803N9H2_CHEQI